MLTGSLTGTSISASYVSASEFTGSGTNIFNLDYNKILYNKPNLNLYALKSYVDGSLNIINSSLFNNLTVSAPLNKDVSNNITINLSSYSTTGNDPNYLKLSGGILTGNLSASNISASEFTGSGTNIFNLDYNKILYNNQI